jgi:hypothetical protein
LENIEVDAAVSAMLRFNVTINLKVPGRDEALLVEFHTPGTMTGKIALESHSDGIAISTTNPFNYLTSRLFSNNAKS